MDLQTARLRLATGWGSLGRESGVIAAEASPTLNKFSASHGNTTIDIPQVLCRRGSSEVAGVEFKEKFYEELEALISTVPQSDKLLFLGDFNARVGKNHQAWEVVTGPHGVDKCNSNGLLLLRTCTIHGLDITRAMFRLPTHNMTLWMHPRSKHWHLIDYVNVRAKDRRDVRVAKSMCNADCWTDHRLISTTKLHIQPMRRLQGQKVVKKLNVYKLKLPAVQQELAATLKSQLTEATGNDWESLKTMVHSATFQLLGPATRNHQDWFDENDAEIQTLLEEKHQLHRAHLSDPSSDAKKDAYDSVEKFIKSFVYCKTPGSATRLMRFKAALTGMT